MRIEVLSPAQWSEMSEDAHRIVFRKQKPSSFDRIDYALLCVDETNTPMGYLTAREMDHETVYWQFGGAFPPVEKSVHAWPIYLSFVEFEKIAQRKRIVTYIENTNLTYLKMAMKAGFRINGVRYARGSVLVEHVLEFENEQ